jgi:hypothetical protein
MSVLESDWRKLRDGDSEEDRERAALRAEADEADEADEREGVAPTEGDRAAGRGREAVGAPSMGRSLFKRTVRRFS